MRIVLLLVVVLFLTAVATALSCSITGKERFTSDSTQFVNMQPITHPKKSLVSTKLIPLIIHQTHKSMSVPPRMKAAMTAWIDKNPEFEHRYYDDDAVRDILLAHKNRDVGKAYKLLKQRYPEKGAMVADLFRLVIIDLHGGVYADVDTRPYPDSEPLYELIDDNDHYISGIGTRNDLHQWCIVSVPNHPFVIHALNETLDTILNDTKDDIIKTFGVEGIGGPPRFDYSVRKLLSSYTDLGELWKPGTFEFRIDDVLHRFRIVKGDYLGGRLEFKYAGYMDDIKSMGASYWAD